MPIRTLAEPNCGNAPRHENTHRFAAALASVDTTELEVLVSPDAEWDILGEHSCRGLPSIIEREGTALAAVELRVFSVITHGRESSIDGEALFDHAHVMNFCHVVRFANAAKTAAISKIRTYHVSSCH